MGIQRGIYTPQGAPTGVGSPTVTTVAASGTSQALALPSGVDSSYDVTLTGNCTFSLSGGTSGKLGTITVILRQDATAGRTVTLPVAVAWPGQSAPTFNLAAGKYDVVQLATVDGGTTWIGSLVASAVQPITVPSAPVSLSANPSTTQTVLTWADAGTGGSAITNHKVYRSTTSGSETLLTTLGSVLTYTDTGLTNGTTYFYKVTAVNSLGEGAQSAELPSTPGHYMNQPSTGYTSTPSIAGMTPGTSTVDLRALIQLANWVPSSNTFLVAKWGTAAGNNQYAMYIDNAGKLNGAWYNAAGVFQGSPCSVATNQPTNSTKWMRALLNPGAGTCTYYTSDDGSTWTQIGTTVSGLTTTAVQTPGTPQLLTAAANNIPGAYMVGKLYKAQLLVNAVSIVSVDFTTATPSAGTLTGGQGETWTVNSPAVIV